MTGLYLNYTGVIPKLLPGNSLITPWMIRVFKGMIEATNWQGRSMQSLSAVDIRRLFSYMHVGCEVKYCPESRE
jgi:hypothetical protein